MVATEKIMTAEELVWIIYPDTREVVIFRSARESLTL